HNCPRRKSHHEENAASPAPLSTCSRQLPETDLKSQRGTVKFPRVTSQRTLLTPQAETRFPKHHHPNATQKQGSQSIITPMLLTLPERLQVNSFSKHYGTDASPEPDATNLPSRDTCRQMRLLPDVGNTQRLWSGCSITLLSLQGVTAHLSQEMWKIKRKDCLADV
ncbi:hypothetical protein LEMLEM_LOCUS13630, partial [Lemmus lemmus]